VRALGERFYARPVLEVARELIGCVVEHADGAGVIVETEAYHDSEPASHAFAGLTSRTQTLFGPPGRAYVYRSYGVHALLNAVCEAPGSGAGVLIRALQPIAGLEAMRVRRGPRAMREVELCSGPGKLTQALGIELSENGCSLSRGPVVIRAASAAWRAAPVVIGPRVGITRAAELPWRFCVAGNPNVSRPRPRSAGGRSPWRVRTTAPRATIRL
jgi:DNA-3-methyladenine glycosylase